MNSTGGVIAIYTNRVPGKLYYDGKASTKLEKLEGYQPDRAFYAPDYSEKLPEHDSPDRRRLLYWNPEVITDEKGMAVLSFYTSTCAGTSAYCPKSLRKSGSNTTLVSPWVTSTLALATYCAVETTFG